MVKVVLVGNLKQFTGGVAEFAFEAATVRQLFQRLGERYPALAPHLEEGIAVAIDGEIHQDAWLEPIDQAEEVHLLPAIGGGSGMGRDGGPNKGTSYLIKQGDMK